MAAILISNFFHQALLFFFAHIMGFDRHLIGCENPFSPFGATYESHR